MEVSESGMENVEPVQQSGLLEKQENAIMGHACPSCGSHNTITDHEAGERYCIGCGLVIDDTLINEGAEWRAFTPQEGDRRSRTGLGVSVLYQPGTTFDVPWNVDTDGRAGLRRMKQEHTKTKIKDNKEKNFTIAKTEINRLLDRLNLGRHMREQSAHIYRKALDADLVRGRNISGIAAGSVYAAIRMDPEKVRTLAQVADVSLLNKKDIARMYSLILRELNIDVHTPMAEYHVRKVAGGVKASSRCENLAIALLDDLRKYNKGAAGAGRGRTGTAGKSPSGLAATAVYLASDYLYELYDEPKITQKVIADASGTTEVTIRNRMKDFGKKGDISEIAKKYGL